MEATNKNKTVEIKLSEDEAFVLLEWLHKFNELEHPFLFEDQAEERILLDLESEMEKVISVTFDSKYYKILSEARQKIRDKE